MCVCIYIYIKIIIHSTHTYIMQTQTFILDAINRDEFFPSTNIFIFNVLNQALVKCTDFGSTL